MKQGSIPNASPRVIVKSLRKEKYDRNRIIAVSGISYFPEHYRF